MTNRTSMHVVGGVLALLMVAASPVNAPMSDVLTLISPNEEFRGAFGVSVAGGGDVNQDGIADLIVGAPNEDPDDSPDDAGRAYLLSGEDGGLLFELVSPNEQNAGGFGGPVATASDVNQDGVLDLLVGAPKEFGSGRAYVLSGRDGSVIFELVSPNQENLGVFGSSVADGGDVNQDGIADIVVGAYGESPDGFSGDAGRAYVFSGQDGGLLFEPASPNETNGGEFGFSVAGGGDINQDGFADLIVGAPNEHFQFNRVGRAYVFSGVDSSVLFELAAPDLGTDGRFGASVAGTGDVNQDGIADLIVGAPANPRGGGEQRGYVFSGRDASLLFELASPNEEGGGDFGNSVAGAGDVNQDGVPDLLVGARFEDGTSLDDAGRAYAFSGQDGSILFQLASPNEERDAYFGFSVRSAGDVNQDGTPDLIVGALNEDPGDSPDDAGRAYVFLSPYPFRINSGGPNYTAVDGTLFVADRAYAPGGFGYVGGLEHHFIQSIGGTDDDPLYQDVRIAREGDADGIFAYRFDVAAAGRYDVTLYLMAPALDGAGNVVMDVKAEEDVVFNDLDVTAEAGGEYQALIKTFAVDVNDGTLDLRFRAVNKAAVVSAIAVVAQTEARGSRVSHQLSRGQ